LCAGKDRLDAGNVRQKGEGRAGKEMERNPAV